MADSTIAITEGTGKLLDAEQVLVGSDQVQRQRIEVVGSAATSIATVGNATPSMSDYGLTVRLPGPTGQDFGTIVTPELSYFYIDGRTRGQQLTAMMSTAVTVASGLQLVSAVTAQQILAIFITITSDTTMTFGLRSSSAVGTQTYVAKVMANVTTHLAAPAHGYLGGSLLGESLWLAVDANCFVVGSVGYVQL